MPLLYQWVNHLARARRVGKAKGGPCPLKYQSLVPAASPKPITQCPASNLGVGRGSGLERKIRMKKGRKGNPELKNVIVTDSEATITDIPAATQIIVTVSGRNSKGRESAPSTPVNGTVP